MDEVPKYRKKKPQKSRSKRRSDHKHLYEKAIHVSINPFCDGMKSFHWAEHCSICGRLGDFQINDDDFRKPEYRGRRLFFSYDMYLPGCEIYAKFPDAPVYMNSPEDTSAYIRIR